LKIVISVSRRRDRQAGAESPNLPRSLYETLQILSLTRSEQMPLDELLAQIDVDQNPSEARNQMNLLINVGPLLCAYNSAICEVASQ
jgi:hypothetical protein